MDSLWQTGRKCLRYKNYDLDYQEMGWLLTYCENHWDDLPFQTRTVSVQKLVATQDYISARVVARYIKRTRLTDDQNHLPYAARLPGDSRIFLLDGHHRWIAAQVKKRKGLRIQIVDLNIVPTAPQEDEVERGTESAEAVLQYEG